VRRVHSPRGGGAASGEFGMLRDARHICAEKQTSAQCNCFDGQRGRSAHVACVFEQVGRAVPGLGQLPRGVLEAPLRDLANTLDFSQPIASLQVGALVSVSVASLRMLLVGSPNMSLRSSPWHSCT
jgi:hypothetical protein